MTTKAQLQLNPNDTVAINGAATALHAQEVVNHVRSRSLSKQSNGDSQDPPRFLDQLEGGISVPEGDPVRLQTRVAPAGDNSLAVEWFKDGKALSAGSRFNVVFDRGYVVLDILYTFPEDAGQYSCVAKSKSGTAQTQPVSINVVPEAGVITETQLPDEQMMAHIREMEEAVAGAERSRFDRTKSSEPPRFLRDLPPSVEVNQGQPIHFETRVEPANDSSMHVEWLKDGNPASTGSRFNLIYDRGFIVLDIAYCIPEDNGEYVCVARNAQGTCESSRLRLTCHPDEVIVTKSNLGAESISNLRRLEEFGEEHGRIISDAKEGIAPSFLSALEPPQMTLKEGAPASYEIKIDPGSGDKLVVEWFKDGSQIKTGSRVTGRLELGVASLVFQYTLPEDSGSYFCVVSTECGHAQSGTVSLACEPEQSIIWATQLPGDKVKGIQAIEALEADLHAPREGPVIQQDPDQPPQIVKQLVPLPDLNEGDTIHFDVRVEPANDNSLNVDWYKNGQQLTAGSRFRLNYDRGEATIDIHHAISEDSGEYWCVARSRNGTAESNRVNVVCIVGATILTSSNLQEGSEGYKRIKEMEEDSVSRESAYEFQNIETVEVESIPVFDFRPQPTTAGEGGPAKFLVRVSGFPRPELVWFINDEPVVQDSLNKIFNDGAINYLEINRCMELGVSKIRVTAGNSLGQTEAETILTVIPMEDFRPELKHITPDNPYKKMMTLRKVECTPELNKALTKPKPSAEAIMKMEHGNEVKTVTFKSAEVAEAEKLYDKVVSGLKKQEFLAGERGHNANSDMPPPPPAIARKPKWPTEDGSHNQAVAEDQLPPPPPEM